MLKRIFDVTFSFLGLIILLPLHLIISVLIKLDSPGPVLYVQDRVGLHNSDFKIYKYRSMFVDSDKLGLITLGEDESRITKIGFYLRKYKIDEFPQLINVLIGNMSFVGPRPEIRKYVNYYSKDDMEILKIKPGVTGYASIKYINETEILEQSVDPEKVYIEEIMPDKIKLNKIYIKKSNLFIDFVLIVRTLFRMVSRF
ncbi:MAG: sugar transferase [Bacteroidia bacterium]|nr:sugar transferase [Bacteroidia bacterium]